MRKELGREGKESTWNAKQKVCRAGFDIEISQVRRTFETRLVQLGVLPKFVNSVIIVQDAVGTGSLDMQRKLAAKFSR